MDDDYFNNFYMNGTNFYQQLYLNRNNYLVFWQGLHEINHYEKSLWKVFEKQKFFTRELKVGIITQDLWYLLTYLITQDLWSYL